MRYVVTSAQLLHFTGNLTFISQIKGDVKVPTLLFEKSRESFLGGVGYSELINGVIAAALGAR